MKTKTLDEVISTIKGHQSTIDMLLTIGAIKAVSSGKRNVSDIKDYIEGAWVIETLYHSSDCTLGFATAPKVDAEFPPHIHEGVTEYLVCISGSFIENIGPSGEYGIRIMRPGECCTIPPGVVHSSRPLEDNTKLAFICVPADSSFDGLFKKR